MKTFINWIISLFKPTKNIASVPYYNLDTQFPIAAEIAFRIEMIHSINEYREKLKLSTLNHQNNFSKVATQHSQDMAAKQKAGHFNFIERVNMFPEYFISEIIGYNYRSTTGYLDAFIKSEKHHEILINPKFTHIGIGYALDNNEKQYVTIIFGK